ncbi:MAG: hypothetical protein HOY78_02660 [Saccharothrix sp.]|nr:hypothetical protein [Saccharothrix sp.]
MTTLDLSSLPWWMYAATAVLVVLTVSLPVLLVVDSRWWHDRKHRGRTELTCDHCSARFVEATRSHRHDAPPLRPLGGPRRRR